jgi:sirohydrochlorin ferrochelatase
MNRLTVLIVGHGSRDAVANQEFERLVARYQTRRPEFLLRYGYLELAQPSLAEALAGLGSDRQPVIVVPLFLFAAGHVKSDVPLALATARRQSPHVEFLPTRALGVHPRMVELALRRAGDALPLDPNDARRTTVIVVSRGSSDQDANGDFCNLVRVFQQGREFGAVLPAFMAVAWPGFEEVLELVARSRPERLLIVPYLLFTGQLMKRLEEQVAAFSSSYPWIKTALAAHLGPVDQVLDVIDERIAETRTDQAPLRCDQFLSADHENH